VSLTRALAQRAADMRVEQLPPDVAEIAGHAIRDWFGVTLGGSRERGPAVLLAALRSETDGEHGSAAGTCTVVGREERLAPRGAALVNGTASHTLDFDDVSIAFPCHASAAVLGGALALAEHLDAELGELLAAFVAGYETTCAVAEALGPAAYARGAHLTGTAGAPGAAAACARLLRLDAARTAVAIGIAASGAAALKCNFGTMTKALHVGRACEIGVLAATLAAQGFTAREDAVEAEQGLVAVLGGPPAETHLSIRGGEDPGDGASGADEPAGGRWYLRENLFKHHASCFYTHSMLEGIAQLRRSGLEPGQVEEVTVHVSELELGACAIAQPRTALEVKFSIAHLAALALLGRATTAIGDADAHDPDALALRSRVMLAQGATAGEPTEVEVQLRDGTVVRARHDVNEPERDLDRQRTRLSEKFLALAAPVLGDARARRLSDALAGLDGGPSGVEGRVRELMTLSQARA